MPRSIRCKRVCWPDVTSPGGADEALAKERERGPATGLRTGRSAAASRQIERHTVLSNSMAAADNSTRADLQREICAMDLGFGHRD